VPQPTGYYTTYLPDTLGNISSVTQNAQAAVGARQSRSYSYDMLDRLVSETNPESGTTQYVFDTPTGTCVSWGYTASYPGDLVAKYDANGNSSCSVYDVTHRLLAQYFFGTNVTPSKHFVYDSDTVNSITMANTKGRLAGAFTCVAGASTCVNNVLTDEYFSYSPRGEPTDLYEWTKDVGVYFHSAASYSPNGVVKTLGLYGTSGALMPLQTYGLDGEGRWSSVSAASGQNPVTSTVYDLANHKTTVNYGSLDSDVFTFNASTGRMSQYKHNIGSQAVTGNLTWNSNSTLGSLAITDPVNAANAQTCNYVHDDLGRVSSTSCGSAWSQTFSFDPFGNISKSGSGNFLATYNSSTNRVSGLTGCTVSYDADGNPLQNCDRGVQDTYTWDAEGHATTIHGGIITYDALGRGVMLNTGTYLEPIVYSPTGGKLASLVTQTVQRGYVPLPGGGTAVYNNYNGASGLSYYSHPDWLGSGRLLTTPTRTVYKDVAYAPYGENYASSGALWDLSFTGQTQDEQSLTYDFLFRDYSAISGRWYSPDPAGLAAVDPSNPQTWNRYAYAGNSPLDTVDPLGLDYGPVIGDDGGGGCYPFDPFCFGCDIAFNCFPPIPIPGPVGGTYEGPYGGPPPAPQRRGGVWANNETLGLPKGLNLKPVRLTDLLGLSPDSNCDFGVCGSASTSFLICGCGSSCVCPNGPNLDKAWITIKLASSIAWYYAWHGLFKQTTDAAKTLGDSEECTARRNAEEARCWAKYGYGGKYGNNQQRNACLQRVEWRWNACLRGFPDPGPPLAEIDDKHEVQSDKNQITQWSIDNFLEAPSHYASF
jgi:RHS repeat-associated protein